MNQIILDGQTCFPSCFGFNFEKNPPVIKKKKLERKMWRFMKFAWHANLCSNSFKISDK